MSPFLESYLKRHIKAALTRMGLSVVSLKRPAGSQKLRRHAPSEENEAVDVGGTVARHQRKREHDRIARHVTTLPMSGDAHIRVTDLQSAMHE
jgi:hypothetical protein